MNSNLRFLKALSLRQNIFAFNSYATSPANTTLNGFMNTVGNTPLVKLEKISKETGCNILVKCEYMNPGGEKT